MPWTVSDFSVGIDPGEYRSVHHLNADEVERSRLAAESADDAAAVGDDAVVVGPAFDHRHRDERIGVDVLCRHRAQVDVRQRVAVDDQESIGGQQRDRARRAARRPENFGLPRITHVDAELGAVADDARDGVGAMMQVEDGAPDARIAQPVKDPNDERRARDGQRGFGSNARERLQASGEAGGQHQRRPRASRLRR